MIFLNVNYNLFSLVIAETSSEIGNFHGFPVATFDRKGNLRHLLGQRFSWYMKRNPSPSRHWQTPESQKSQVTSQQFLFQFFSSNR